MDEGDSPSPSYQVLNLIRSSPKTRKWEKVGVIAEKGISLETIRWPGKGILGSSMDMIERDVYSNAYRVVTIVSPPFVMESQAEDNRTCVRGLTCLKLKSVSKDDLAIAFAQWESGRLNPDLYDIACCDGLAMDLLSSVARELKFEIDLFLVPDGYFGLRNGRGEWNGLMGALVSGAAHICFAPISVHMELHHCPVGP